ncbi:GH23913 [Drosophila grimshawi]|uniref:GH23913 n=1 Tax=Drosophila grimshawi TaxID=7222 RepID=B4K2L8_DROGR|nr:GH23913 [Drosophila grimshawi]
MSAKTSPSNSREGNVAAAASVVPPNVAGGGVVQIKKELPSDEIKVRFMNEKQTHRCRNTHTHTHTHTCIVASI